jgi:hypothetical protein
MGAASAKPLPFTPDGLATSTPSQWLVRTQQALDYLLERTSFQCTTYSPDDLHGVVFLDYSEEQSRRGGHT